MMHDQAMRFFGAVISSLVCGAFVAACAGGDTPPVNDGLESAIAQNFGNGVPVGAAGSGGGATGSAGSANAPAAGSGGSAAQPPDDENEPVPPAPSGGSGGGDDEPPEEEDPPPNTGGACDGFAVLETNCSGGSCHGAGGLGNFAESEEAARAFIGVSGTITCGSEGPLLNPDNPRQSIIVQKVNGTVPCGQAMPIGATLSDEDISCLEEWIATL